MASLIDDIFAQTNGKKDKKAAASNGELKTKKAPSEISSSTPSADKKKKKKRKVEDAEPQQQQQQQQQGGDASSKSKKAKLKGKARQTEPETILDPSAPRPTATTTTQTASSSSTSQRTQGRAFEAALDEDDLAFADSRGSARKRTEEGFPIYSESELKIGQGGGTPLCPFDCDCCF
ncbi:unnamed protein product [Tilletia laevis]|uniref:DUF1764-domain-containing protein n=3 Tax=Tilletia TaxID=13289 RepID=A0A8X7MSU6_9BASI|nr:hypothetical protein CF336_g900 [Tilletia laevis]KAE8202940.1 hypothetical protein CF328_g1932 [Tilletia controversa]KAE8263623.1 hypothetical protein A4X03_0g1544 [Tilletia caries]KAE8247887.1 hypothetical protein A4X06_0g4113 [Tilletia controversa]CAD6888472.1 unnamed protein product [Tilletia caries]